MLQQKSVDLDSAKIKAEFETVEGLARRLQINKFTVYHWLKDEPERLPRVTRLFGRVLFSERDIHDFLRCPPPERESMRGKYPRKTKSQPKVLRRGPGRPTKAEQIAVRMQAGAGGAA